MRKFFLLFLAVIFMAALPFFTGQSLGASSIVVAVDAPPRTMNPHGSDADANLSVMANFFEGLLQRKAPEGNLFPALAVRYEHPDLLTWKFYLRKGVRFHNGNPFTAEDVKFSFERLSDPKVSEFINAGKSIASIDIIDDSTVIIKTKDPIPWFANNLHQVFIMDKESTESRSLGEVKQVPIGTGAYKFVERVKGSYVKMVENKNYWGGTPSIKSVELRVIKGFSKRVDALTSGQVELVSDVPYELYNEVQKNPKIEAITRPSRTCVFLALGNSPESPLADIRVRKAIYMAINEEEIIQKIMRDRASKATQIVDPATTGYEPNLERLPYEPEMAKELLREAGYEKGFKITLSGPNDLYSHDEEILEAVARYLIKVGIRAKIDMKPRSVLLPEIFQGTLEFCLIGWFDRSFDLGRTYLKFIHTRDRNKNLGSLNSTNFSALSIDAFLEYTCSLVDQEAREILLQDLNKMAMIDKIAWIPLHYQQDIYAIQKGKGIKFQPRPDKWIVFREIFKR